MVKRETYEDPSVSFHRVLTQAEITQKTPLAIAVSGGGDSVALMHMARHMNPFIFIIDHGLRRGSNSEALRVKKQAEGLGLKALVLSWAHHGIKTALQEKARKARYHLLGAACRDHNIKHLLVGHSADDQAETVLMRLDRGTGWRGAAGMRTVSYGGLWPELAGIYLIRPLLGVSRAGLRRYNRAHGLDWIEDPSNENLKFTRIVARQRLAQKPVLRRAMLALSGDMQMGRRAEREYFDQNFRPYVRVDDAGGIYLSRPVPPAFLRILIMSASGKGGYIDQASLAALAKSLWHDDFKAHTLAGAYVVRQGEGRYFTRDPVAVKGRAHMAPIGQSPLERDQLSLWDGRFWIKSRRAGLSVRPLWGYVGKLKGALHDYVNALPAAARPALPLIMAGEDIITVAAVPIADLYIKAAISDEFLRYEVA